MGTKMDKNTTSATIRRSIRWWVVVRRKISKIRKERLNIRNKEIRVSWEQVMINSINQP